MGWCAVRSVYLFGQKSDGTNIFEERVVCFLADSIDEAFAKAAREAERYAAANGFEVHADQDLYVQDGEALIDGYEVWSVMLEGRESLTEFYAKRYQKLDYHPE